ncbi:MAG: effector binding domain-containing protein [Beduini sp.]|uniref:AraC family transcriptional regulator n=1 Tax=Beduini sp. TaxID=1922300 RepID=UPI0039A2DB2C
MDWNTVLQDIIDYIENHLQRDEEPINNDEIARIAGCSFNFFQKVFSYMNKISFAEYIRYRKLTLAGYDIKSTNLKVVEISYKYGYDSPTSFTKAFQQFHGVSPKAARSRDVELKVYPKMQMHSKQQYAWRLEQKKGFRLIGKKIKVSRKNNAHYSKVPEFWSECQRDGVFSKLISLDTSKNQGIFGLFGKTDPLSDEIEYAIMVISDQGLPDGFEEIIIPEETWAIFDCLGPTPQAIQNGWRYLLEEWVIKYPFDHADCPELEWYSNGNSYDEQYLSQIWIPIIE